VESLIKSILGGLEGLINILDSEGGFGSLEMQVDNFFVYLYDFWLIALSLTSKILPAFPRASSSSLK
jgi:hypothetical protein